MTRSVLSLKSTFRSGREAISAADSETVNPVRVHEMIQRTGRDFCMRTGLMQIEQFKN